MKSTTFTLLTLLANLALPAWAAPMGLVKVSDPPRGESVQNDEPAFGRRLSAHELAELRKQVRQQWAETPDSGRSAASMPAERMMPGSTAQGGSPPSSNGARP